MNWNRKTVLILILLSLYLLLFLPIWQPVLLGYLFASACAPALRWLQATLKSKRSPLAYATALASVLVFLLVLVYLGFRTYTFVYKLAENPDTFSQLSDQAFDLKQKASTWLSQKGFWTAEETSAHLDRLITKSTVSGRDFLLETSKTILTKTPQILLVLVIFFLAFIAFLLGGTRVASLLGKQFGWADLKKAQLKFENICALSLGSVILTSFLQASLVTIGSAIVGLPSLFLIFLITFICSMIPVVGAAAVPLVLAAFQLVNSEISHVIILVITAAIAGTADNVLKAYLFSRAAKTNPLISLMALIGGIALFGFPGLFIAPVVEQLLMTSLENE